MGTSRRTKGVVILIALVTIVALLVGGEGADARRRHRRHRRHPTPTPAPSATPTPTPRGPGLPPPPINGLQLTYVTEVTPIEGGAFATVDAECPGGTKLLGGGSFLTGPSFEGFLFSATPISTSLDQDLEVFRSTAKN